MNGHSLLTGLLASSLASVALAQTAPATSPPIVSPSAGVDTAEAPLGVEHQSLAGRFEGGLRTGLGLGLGKAGSDRDVHDIVEWRVPVWIDLGYRVSEPLTLGAYAQLGLGGSGEYCGGSCNLSDLRLGAQALWHAANGPLWLGVGLGYEWLSLYVLQVSPEVVLDSTNTGAVSQLASRTAETLSGPELTLQAGLDFELEPGLSLGPYLSASAGTYVSDSVECDVVECPAGDIEGSALHGWIGIGVRGSYNP